MASSSVFAELVRDCKLDGSNFTVWKRKTMFLLTAENIEYVAMMDEPNEPAKEADDEEKESYREELKEWTKDNKRAKIFILGSMTDSLAGEYESEDVACVIMRRLEEDFGEVSLIKVLSLVNKFLTSKLTESGSVNEHLNKMCMLSEELKNAGYPFSEEVQVMVALNSLPHSWEQFKVSFCHSERSLNMCTLRHHLIMEQDRKSSQGKEKYSQSTELHLGEERRSRNKKNSGKDLRDKLNKKRQWSDHPKSKINKKNYKCHHCGELGHFRADCLSRKKQYNPNENQRKQQENKNENSSPDATSWGFLLLLYVFVQMTRLVVVSVMYPLLRSLGYGLDFKEATVIVWSGLRGAVSLSLSMSVKRASDAAQPFLAPEVGTMFVFFTGGIVFLTLILNGSTTQFLLHVLGMDKLSATKLRMLNYTRYELLNKALEAFGDLRDDEELGPADWVTVKKYITYLSNLEGEHVHPHADQHEHIQTMNLRDIRVRLLNGVQATYWRMLEEGRITQATANILMRSVDEAMDLVASGSLCDWNGLRSNVHLPSYYRFLSMSRLPQRFITYFTVKRLESGCYICAAFLRAHRIARRQLQDFLGDSEIARIVIDESNAVGEEARMFLEEVRCTFPQLLSVLKTRQVTYSVLTHLSEYVQNLQKTGLLEEKEMVHLDMLCRDLKKLKSPPLVKMPRVGDLLDTHPLIGVLPSTVRAPLLHNTKENVIGRGTTLYNEGSRATGIWIVSIGVVKWTSQRLSSRQSLDPILSHGSTLGLYEVLTGKSYICDMITDSLMRCFFIEAEKIDQLRRKALARLLIPRIFERMGMHEIRLLIANGSSMSLYTGGEDIVLEHNYIGILLEGFLKAKNQNNIVPPVVLLPLNMDPKMLGLESSAMNHMGNCYAAARYQVEARSRVIIFEAGRLLLSEANVQGSSSFLSWLESSQRPSSLTSSRDESASFSAKALKLSMYGSMEESTEEDVIVPVRVDSPSKLSLLGQSSGAPRGN